MLMGKALSVTRLLTDSKCFMEYLRLLAGMEVLEELGLCVHPIRLLQESIVVADAGLERSSTPDHLATAFARYALLHRVHWLIMR